MLTSALVLYLYGVLRLLPPLKWRIGWKILLAGLLLPVALKGHLFQWFGGGMYFSPELPPAVLLAGAVLYQTFIILLLFLLGRDAVWIGLWIFRKKWNPNRVTLILALLSLVLSGIGTWNARKLPEIRTHEVFLPELPPELDGFSIALLADLHIGPLFSRSFTEAVVERTNAAKPDLIVLNGDLIDGKPEKRRAAVEPLKNLHAPQGVFACPGNHEYYSGFAEWQKEFSRLGIVLLCNGHREIRKNGASFLLAGITDRSAAKRGMEPPDLAKALKDATPGKRILLLAHQPGTAAAHAESGVDLQLSGHTHGGMMPVFRELVGMLNGGYVCGWYPVGKMKLFVSPGSGIWCGFPVRIGVPQEISLFILRKK